MKIYLLLLLSIILLSSCEDNPTKTIEVGVDKYQFIDTYPRNYSTVFMRDSDTLKIEIRDSSVASILESPFVFISISAVLTDSSANSRNLVYELITSDLSIEQNPDRKDEFWVFGFKPNLDSNRRYIFTRFDRYYVDLVFSKLNPYYYNRSFMVYVESSTE